MKTLILPLISRVFYFLFSPCFDNERYRRSQQRRALFARGNSSQHEQTCRFSSSHASPTASFPASFKFWFRIHCTRMWSRYFFLILSLTFSIHLPRVENLFLFYHFLVTRHAMATLYSHTLLFSLSLEFSMNLCRWSVHARASHVAFSAFLSTENDLHHNLRPNIGGHTSRHNNRMRSEILNSQKGRGEGGGCFEKKGDGMGGKGEKTIENS